MKKTIIGIVFVFLLSFMIVSAISISILNPSRTLHNLTVGETISGFVWVENKNNYSVVATIEPPKDMLFVFSQLNKTLSVGEKQTFNYSLQIEKSGNYTAIITVLFSKEISENSTEKAESTAFGAKIIFYNVQEAQGEEIKEKTTISGIGSGSSSGTGSSSSSKNSKNISIQINQSIETGAEPSNEREKVLAGGGFSETIVSTTPEDVSTTIPSTISNRLKIILISVISGFIVLCVILLWPRRKKEQNGT